MSGSQLVSVSRKSLKSSILRILLVLRQKVVVKIHCSTTNRRWEKFISVVVFLWKMWIWHFFALTTVPKPVKKLMTVFCYENITVVIFLWIADKLEWWKLWIMTHQTGYFKIEMIGKPCFIIMQCRSKGFVATLVEQIHSLVSYVIIDCSMIRLRTIWVWLCSYSIMIIFPLLNLHFLDLWNPLMTFSLAAAKTFL